MFKKGGFPFFLTFSAIYLPSVKQLNYCIMMKRCSEFEVILPSEFFDLVPEAVLASLLAPFHVSLLFKGYDDCYLTSEYLVICPGGYDYANSVRAFLTSLHLLFDQMESVQTRWIIGSVRVIDDFA